MLKPPTHILYIYIYIYVYVYVHILVDPTWHFPSSPALQNFWLQTSQETIRGFTTSKVENPRWALGSEAPTKAPGGCLWQEQWWVSWEFFPTLLFCCLQKLLVIIRTSVFNLDLRSLSRVHVNVIHMKDATRTGTAEGRNLQVEALLVSSLQMLPQ